MRSALLPTRRGLLSIPAPARDGALQVRRGSADHEIIMLRMENEGSRNDDPRKLREMLVRAQGLASEHDLPSVVVGLAGEEGDLVVSEVMDFLESQLRVDDSIFRMTRERAVLLLADVDVDRARDIVERLAQKACGGSRRGTPPWAPTR